MGYRLIVAVCSLVLVCSCAAFDKDTDAIEGFGDQDRETMPSVVKDAGAYHGYYTGVMILDSNSCQSISDEEGTQTRFGADVLHKGDTINITFDDKSTAAGIVKDDKVIIMTDVEGPEHVYYLTFAADEENKDLGTVNGSCEVIETDENGYFGEPCASYTIEMEKGEKPAEEASEDEKDAEEEKKE